MDSSPASQRRAELELSTANLGSLPNTGGSATPPMRALRMFLGTIERFDQISVQQRADQRDHSIADDDSIETDVINSAVRVTAGRLEYDDCIVVQVTTAQLALGLIVSQHFNGKFFKLASILKVLSAENNSCCCRTSQQQIVVQLRHFFSLFLIDIPTQSF